MSLRWEHCKHGHVPKDAVFGGWEAGKGEPLFVGRAHHAGSLIPGKVHPSHRCLYVAYGGAEHKKDEYEVLVNPGNHVHLEWVHRKNGNVPDSAVQGGRDGSGEIYYIGRHSHRGDTLCGKIHPSHECVYLAYAGKEISKKEYAVLITK